MLCAGAGRGYPLVLRLIFLMYEQLCCNGCFEIIVKGGVL